MTKPCTHNPKYQIMFARNGCLACQCEHEAELKQKAIELLRRTIVGDSIIEAKLFVEEQGNQHFSLP